MSLLLSKKNKNGKCFHSLPPKTDIIQLPRGQRQCYNEKKGVTDHLNGFSTTRDHCTVAEEVSRLRPGSITVKHVLLKIVDVMGK